MPDDESGYDRRLGGTDSGVKTSNRQEFVK